MKKILTSILTLITLSSSVAFAHTGHVADESLHGFLHVEHIIALAAIVLTAYLLSKSKNK